MIQIDLQGKRALVTGGSRGIGADICRKLASCDADVFINYLSNEAKAEELAQELRRTSSSRIVTGKADVSDSVQVSRMFRELEQELGGIDILVNNAGAETVAHVLEMTEEEWDRIIDINLKGPFLCSQQAGRMMEKDGGVIINISSIHDAVPRKGLVHYCAAKAGLKMLSKCLSLELAENNVRVVSVAPGAIATEMNREEIARFGVEKFEGWIPQGRVGEVGDVASVVAFLASDLSAYVNGADVYIDGSYMNNTIQYDPRPKRSK